MQNMRKIALTLALVMVLALVGGAASYTVQSGDVLWRIAQDFGTDYMSLAKANGIDNPNLIYPGQVITWGETATEPTPEPEVPMEPMVHYSATAQGFGGTVEVFLSYQGDTLVDVGVEGDAETAGIGTKAIEAMPAMILAAGSADVDNVAGATVTADAIKAATKAAIDKKMGVMPEDAGMVSGTYETTVVGAQGPLTVEVTLTEDAISNVVVTNHVETPSVGDVAVEKIPTAIVEYNSIAVDSIAGVTVTSSAIKRAVTECITTAGGNTADFMAYNPPAAEDIEMTADVVIVGGGGAGMSAAATALEAGASVIVIEKTGFIGGNSIIAGGIYNAPDPSKQDDSTFAGDLDSYIEAVLAEEPVNEVHEELLAIIEKDFEEYKNSDRAMFDSPEFFAVQSWNAGDKVGDLAMMYLMTSNSLDTLHWFESYGMEFDEEVTLASGSLYPRTHGAILPNGTGYFHALDNAIAQYDNFTLLMDTEGTSLIMDGDAVVGVNAVGKDGNTVTLHANSGVIMATGGFAGNVELREQYADKEKWPDLGPQVPTSNMAGVTGDGIFMAQDAGAQLVNMDQVQLLHICNPITGLTTEITVVDMFVNQEGNRFVREDGRRDEMSKAIIAQTGGIMYSIFSADYTPNGEETKALGGMTLGYMLENDIAGYVKADTIEELAELLDMPADALAKSVADHNSFVDGTATDPLGRVAFQGKKIETGPFYAYPRSPAVHHTMGGVVIDEETRVLNDNGDVIDGLYAAGEITGILHGANRVGGNAIVDFAVFGRIAGESAAMDK